MQKEEMIGVSVCVCVLGGEEKRETDRNIEGQRQKDREKNSFEFLESNIPEASSIPALSINHRV